MLSLKSISETLAVLGGVALIGCGSSQAPVNATEVEAKPAGGEVTESVQEAAGATTSNPAEVAPAPEATAAATTTAAAPTTTAVASGVPTAAKTATPAKGGTGKAGTGKTGAKKGAESKCGEGSCG